MVLTRRFSRSIFGFTVALFLEFLEFLPAINSSSIHLIFYSRCALIFSANDMVIPGTLERSSGVAAFIISTDQKCFKRAFRRAGPIPGILSNAEANPNLVRFLRWAVIAKR